MDLENAYNKMSSKSAFNFGSFIKKARILKNLSTELLNEIYAKYKDIFINEEKTTKLLENEKVPVIELIF